MADFIDRQAAIDAFKKELTVGESKGKYVTICSAVSYEGAKQILESLPSAQPEIIRCKECSRWFICHRSEDWYCADADRRKDGIN